MLDHDNAICTNEIVELVQDSYDAIAPYSA